MAWGRGAHALLRASGGVRGEVARRTGTSVLPTVEAARAGVSPARGEGGGDMRALVGCERSGTQLAGGLQHGTRWHSRGPAIAPAAIGTVRTPDPLCDSSGCSLPTGWLSAGDGIGVMGGMGALAQWAAGAGWDRHDSRPSQEERGGNAAATTRLAHLPGVHGYRSAASKLVVEPPASSLLRVQRDTSRWSASRLVNPSWLE
jgi:hypothetical protein